MKWSLNTYGTCQEWDLDKLLEIAKATGYEWIEFLMDYNQPHGVEAYISAEKRAEIKAKVDASGLKFGSLTSCITFHSLDASERQKSVAQVKNVIDMAREFGCDHVRVLGDRVPEDENKQTVLKNVSDCLRELGEYAQDDDIAVSMEMHGSFSNPEYSLEVIHAANLPNVGLVFNCQWRVGAESGWSLPAGSASIAPLYEMMKNHLTSIHTHSMEDPEEFEYYREMFQLLKRDGYQGYVSNESAYRGPDPEKVLSLYTALFRAFT